MVYDQPLLGVNQSGEFHSLSTLPCLHVVLRDMNSPSWAPNEWPAVVLLVAEVRAKATAGVMTGVLTHYIHEFEAN